MTADIKWAAVLSALVVLTSGAYVEIYRVERTVKLLTRQILFVYALAAPFKVLNMILGGGILRSGGRTAYVMGIDMLGTWLFGVPLGLLGAFVWKLPIAYVYLLLSLEECVRFAVSMAVFRRRVQSARFCGLSLDFPVFIRNSLFIPAGLCYTENRPPQAVYRFAEERSI